MLSIFKVSITYLCFIITLHTSVQGVPTPQLLDFLFGPAAPPNPLIPLSEDSALANSIRQFSQYAETSYCQTPAVEQFICNSCFPRIQEGEFIRVFDNSSMSAFSFVRYDQEVNTIVVGFRGTSNLQNWQSNLRMLPTSYKPMYENITAIPDDAQIHRGFWAVFESLRQNLTETIQATWNQQIGVPHANPLTIVTTGHSLGGALAGIAALHIQNVMDLPPGSVLSYSFNQPKVGNTAFTRYYDQRVTTYRVTNGNDPFVHAPIGFLGFVHYGTEVFVDLDGKTWICPEQEDRRCSRQFVINFDQRRHSNISAFNFSTNCTTG
ncbi:Alpha/Beta hydrolase protein [Paraphysoderma sedebokerense]|nr:Alpha/Beta hydrolase protein [Paraphysoderma sedebokerense]